MIRIFVFTALFGIVSCGQGSVSAYKSEALEEIKSILNSTLPCSSEKNENTGLCSRVSVGFQKKEPSVTSLGQRFLIIDQGMRTPAYTRYKTRVLDDIEPDETGEYNSVVRPVELYRGELQILSEVLAERYPRTSAGSLSSISRQMHQTFPNYDVYHGDAVFSTIADLNLDAEFVIAQLFKTPKTELCSLEVDTGSFKKLENYFKSASSSLVEIIKKYKISFVNMSFGHGMDMMTDLSLKCGGGNLSQTTQRQVLKMIQQNFYEPLFALPEVIFVQAAPSLNHDLKENDLDYPSDCTFYPNRVRVGSRDGNYYNSDCVDVFIDSSVYEYNVTRNGIGSSSFPPPICTSWAAAFVSSYINKQKQDHVSKNSQFSLKRWLKSGFILEGTPR